MTYTFVPDFDAELVVEAATRTHEIWSGGWALEAHIERHLDSLRRAAPGQLRFVGVKDESGLVASLKRYAFDVHVPGVGPMPGVGIGAVFTRKDARKKGAAATLLRWLLDDARAEGVVLALLYSEIGTAYYERLGFVTLPSLEHTAATNQFPETTPLQVRPASLEDEPLLPGLYEDSWEPSIVRMVRTPNHWRYFRYRNAAELVFVLCRGAEPVGYVIAALHDGSRANAEGVAVSSRVLWVDEWAAPGISITEILGALRVIAEGQSASRIAGWLPPAHEHAPFVANPRHEPIAMVCPLQPPLTSIQPDKTFFGYFDHF